MTSVIFQKASGSEIGIRRSGEMISPFSKALSFSVLDLFPLFVRQLLYYADHLFLFARFSKNYYVSSASFAWACLSFSACIVSYSFISPSPKPERPKRLRDVAFCCRSYCLLFWWIDNWIPFILASLQIVVAYFINESNSSGLVWPDRSIPCLVDFLHPIF